MYDILLAKMSGPRHSWSAPHKRCGTLDQRRNHFFHRSHRCIVVQGRLNSDPVYCEHKLGHTLTIKQILIILRLFQVGEYSYCFWRFSGFNFIQTKKRGQCAIYGWIILKGFCMVADLCYFKIYRILERRMSSFHYFEAKKTINKRQQNNNLRYFFFCIKIT